jgi:hypothetical protein
MDARALENLEEVADQTSVRVNELTRRIPRGGLFGWHASPNIERAKAAHVVEEPIAAKESAEPETPAPIVHIFSAADVETYTELINAIRSRVGELGIRYQDFDSLADFPSGLSGKIFGPSQVKRVGPEKLFDALRAASLKIRIEPDEEQLRRMQKSMAENCQPRQAKQARMNNHSHLSNKFIDSVLDYLANKKGGVARLNKAVKQARSNHARRTIAIGVNWAQQRSLQHISEETTAG